MGGLGGGWDSGAAGCTSQQPQDRGGGAAGWFQVAPKPVKQSQGQSEKWQLQGQRHTRRTMDGPDREGTF